MIYEKQLEIRYTPDIFVAGGGPSGICAAIAAAKMGKSVFIAEAGGAFGGMGTTGLVPAFAPFGDGVNNLSSGIGYDIVSSLTKNNIPGTWTMHNIEELKRAYDKAIIDAGIDFSFFTCVYDVITTNGKIDYVILGSKTGLFAIKAKIYVDCTGDGDLCAFAGAEYELGDENGEVMPQTLCSMWTNIERTKAKGAFNKHVEQAFSDGVLSKEDRHVPGFFHGVGATSGGNIGHTFNVNPTDERSLTRAMLDGRNLMPEYEAYFKTYFEGYENAELCTTANVLGVRESRRIVCDYMLNVDDFINRAVFEDEIGRCCYPVDIHVMSTDKAEYDRFHEEYTKNLRYSKGESYGIPYRSLIPISLKNTLVAGRCIGCDRKMQASVRVMPGCFVTGQAAGVAAALACENEDVRTVDTPLLKQNLKALGAYLPNG